VKPVLDLSIYSAFGGNDSFQSSIIMSESDSLMMLGITDLTPLGDIENFDVVIPMSDEDRKVEE
jgi:hypothetical protein